MSYAYKFEDNHEASFGKQLAEMLSYQGKPYYEIWIGTDGYAVSSPDYKIFDAKTNDDTKLKEVLGISRKKLDDLVIMRAGCAYSLSPELYEKRTGAPYPQEIADEYGLTSIVVLVVSLEDALSRIRVGKMVQ